MQTNFASIISRHFSPLIMADSSPTVLSLSDFASFYLYGLTNNPYQQSTDLAKFGQLYSLVVGEHGGVGLASSFHPYQLVNQAGATVWQVAYAQLYTQPNRAELFEAMAEQQARFVIAPPASFSEFHIWPDTRLTSTENPTFSKYVPFVLPFLVRKGPAPLRWDTELDAREADPDRFRTYLNAVNEAIRFVQPAPAFVLGFDEFDEQHPEWMIERFMSCLPMLK